jgi:broad specificity phosphatase PhoE
MLAGQYIRDEFPRQFKQCLHSPSSRAVQTARLLSLPGASWSTDENLSEKRPGESWEQLVRRMQATASMLAECGNDANRVLVYHGDAMHAMRAHREDFGANLAALLEAPFKYFNHTQLIIYTDEPPEGQNTKPGGRWVKSVCPWSNGDFGHDWIEIARC